MDSRHDPSARDLELLELLEEAQAPTLIVATKVDKLRASQRAQVAKRFRKMLELDEDALIIPYSSQTRQGLPELWEVIDEALDGERARA